MPLESSHEDYWLSSRAPTVNADQFFDKVRSLPLAPWQELTGAQPFVVLSPHPDDESLGAAGLIALASRAKQYASIVLLTDGSASHPQSRSYPPARLSATRRAELEHACEILGVPAHGLHALNLPDAAAPTFGPSFEKAVTALFRILEKAAATTLFVTWREDPHCDHHAAALIAEEVRRRVPQIRLWAYPIWGWHLAASTPVMHAPHGRRIDITGVQQIKRAAIAAHASQMTDLIADDPNGFRFTDAILAPFSGRFEYFLEVPP